MRAWVLRVPPQEADRERKTFNLLPLPRQARLMELAGVAADIADARAPPTTATPAAVADRRPAGRQHRAHAAALPGNGSIAPPLALFGSVGEGPPADSMAQEALLLWVAIALAPAKSWTASSFVSRGEASKDASAGGEAVLVRPSQVDAMDEPILKGIFCASDAIRRRLARSLLEVCGDGGDGGRAVEPPAPPPVDAVAGGGSKAAGREGERGEMEEEGDAASASDYASASATATVTATGLTLEVEAEAGAEAEASAASSEVVGMSDGGTEEDDVVLVRLGDGRDPESSSAAPNAAGAEKSAAATTALSTSGEVPEEVACRGGGERVVCPSAGELREHVVRLLLNSIPRVDKSGVSGGTRAGKVPRAVPRWKQRDRKRDCTELFDVVCALVKVKVKVKVKTPPPR